MGMKREWVRFAVAAALGAAAAVAFDAGSTYRKRSESRVAGGLRPHGEPTAAGRALERIELPLLGPAPTPKSSPTDATNPKGRLKHQLDRVNDKLATVQREKAQLQGEKRDLETQLLALKGEVAERDSYKYDLSQEDWKKLAAEGRVRYRMPCLMPLETGWKMPQQELDQLGLSPEDAEILAQAQRRSNHRVWDTLRPRCMKIVNNAEVVDLLGATSCQHLIEKVASRSERAAVMEARRQVAEVHAGLRPPPAAGQPQHPVFESLMTFSSEGKRFEADLAESFGPEEAKRIWQSMSCAARRD